MGDYFKGEKLSTTYTQVVGIGGADDRDGIHATTQKTIWTDDGDGGVNLFPFKAARDAMQFTGTNRLEFNDDAVYIHSSSDGILTTSADVSTVIGTALLDINASAGITIDGTTVSIDGTGASNFTATGGNLTLSTVTSGEMFLTPVNYIQVASGKKLQFADSGEYLSGDGTNLTLGSGADINLTATGDVNIPSGIGVTYGDDGEKIEGDGTDLTISSSAKLNLTATSDIHIPKNVGLVFDDNASEKIESNNTNLTINSGADINLTCATGDVNIPADIGLTMGSDNQKIEGDGTDLAISATGNINVTSTVNEANSIYLRANAGTSETIKIHADQGTAVTEGAASVSLLSDAGGVELRSTANLANAINLTVDSGTTSSMTLFNDTGSSVTDEAASIQLLSDVGGIGIASKSGLANAIYLHANGGGSETIKVHADQGTGAASIELTSDAGGIGINTTATGKSLDINTAILDIDATEASNITMTTNTGSTTSLTIEATNSNGSYDSDIVIDADGQVHINANDTTNSYAGAGIQIGTDLSGVDISIGHTTSDVRIGDDLTVTGNQTVDGNLTVSGSFTATTTSDAAAVSSGTPLYTLTNTTHENNDLDGSSDTSDGRETRMVFKGEKSDGTVHELATIVTGHNGTGNDLKGQMQFFTNSGSDSNGALTNAMNIVETGFVGMGGQLAPEAQLHIGGANPQIRIGDDGAEDTSLCFMGNAQDFYIALDDTTDDLTIGTGTTIGSSVKMVVENGGNVGIGTVAPDAPLVVRKDETGSSSSIKTDQSYSAIVIDTDFTADSIIPGIAWNTADNNDGKPKMAIWGTTATAQSNMYIGCSSGYATGVTDTTLTISGAGTVGIGTANPLNTLHVTHSSGDGNNGVMIINEATTVADGDLLGAIGFDSMDGNAPSSVLESSCFIAAYAAEAHAATDKGGDLVFGCTLIDDNDDTTSHEYMRILDSGRVGIGIANPAAKLDVVTGDAATTTGFRVSDSSGTIDGNKVLVDLDYSGDDDVTNGIYIQFQDSDGVIGSIDAANGTTVAYNTSSDYRLKEDFKDIIDATDTINKLKLYNFKWKKDGVRSDGIVAHEVAEVYSQPISGEKDAMTTKEYENKNGEKKTKEVIAPQSVDYSKFVPLLLKSIQELSAKVEALEKAK